MKRDPAIQAINEALKPPKDYRDPRFVKFGEFNRAVICWWTKHAGYFWTDNLGYGMNGDFRVPEPEVRKKAYAGK